MCALWAAKSIFRGEHHRERETRRLGGGGRSLVRTLLCQIPCYQEKAPHENPPVHISHRGMEPCRERKRNQKFLVKEKRMKTYLAILLTLCVAFVSRAQGQGLPTQPTSGLLRLVQTIPLPTEGYMDRLTVDIKGQRLFICGENNKTLIAVDLRAGKVIHETVLAASPK